MHGATYVVNAIFKSERLNNKNVVIDIGEAFDILKEVNTENVEPMTHLVHHENVAREDIAQPEHPKVIMRMMQLVPALKDGFVKVKESLKREA